MARSKYSAFIFTSFLLLGAVGAWADVGGANAPNTPGIFAQPFGPNQPADAPGGLLAPEPGISPLDPSATSPAYPPGAQQPGTVPEEERLPTGTSCAGGFSATPGFQCPEPGTLPGSIPSTSNSNMFSGKSNSPTQPGSPGTVPGQAGSPYGAPGPAIEIQPSQPQGYMTPQR